MTRQTELTAVEEKVADWVEEKEQLGDLIKEKEDMFRTQKKQLTFLKSVTNPLLKEQRDVEAQVRISDLFKRS